MGPMLAAVLQGSLLAAISNILGQYLDARIANHAFKLNVVDVLRFFCLHICTAPPNYRWQEFLDRHFPARTEYLEPTTLPLHDIHLKRPETEDHDQRTAGSKWWPARLNRNRRTIGKLNLKNTMIKWFLDSITLGALANTCAFLVIFGIFRGQSWSKIKLNLLTETFPIIFAGYKVWPIANFISFALVPVHRRILFFSCIGLMWNIYMRVFTFCSRVLENLVANQLQDSYRSATMKGYSRRSSSELNTVARNIKKATMQLAIIVLAGQSSKLQLEARAKQAQRARSNPRLR
ncbi:uncharacterized protein AB675_9717 [Cyphellophora attinorum]|uniref:PXMP2/4 family protein 3 n=1 Tax=Cyphellophora attinorum TaxID=1664694 RepID=A0A0N0NP82_9EURO|nr:uncharacterized protein AB675_9717 [Phialophora attinorum]KPI42451.1 hypothetical protein AB675_9717 [Phialophora attinorum]